MGCVTRLHIFDGEMDCWSWEFACLVVCFVVLLVGRIQDLFPVEVSLGAHAYIQEPTWLFTGWVVYDGMAWRAVVLSMVLFV